MTLFHIFDRFLSDQNASSVWSEKLYLRGTNDRHDFEVDHPDLWTRVVRVSGVCLERLGVHRMGGADGRAVPDRLATCGATMNALVSERMRPLYRHGAGASKIWLAWTALTRSTILPQDLVLLTSLHHNQRCGLPNRPKLLAKIPGNAAPLRPGRVTRASVTSYRIA